MVLLQKYGLYLIAGIGVFTLTYVLATKAMDRYESLVATEANYNTLVAIAKANQKQTEIKDNINNINLNNINDTIDIIETKNDSITKIDNIFKNINEVLVEEEEIELDTKVISNTETKPKLTIPNNKKLVVDTLTKLSNSLDQQIENLPNI